jgi:hypothetical protein
MKMRFSLFCFYFVFLRKMLLDNYEFEQFGLDKPIQKSEKVDIDYSDMVDGVRNVRDINLYSAMEECEQSVYFIIWKFINFMYF